MTQLPRDTRSHSILDPIQGLVRLTDAEFAVVDHALFRRLRNIKQNGLLYLVFPSATHTRFEHSIGAMHLADSMLEQVWLNSVVGRGKGAVVEFESTQGNVAIDLSEVPTDILQWVVRVTRLAALVHDLGHGPLSHAFDSFGIFRDDLAILLEGGTIPLLRPVASDLVGWDRRGVEGSVSFDRTPHEVISCVLFAHLWAEVRKHGALGTDFEGSAELPLVVAACVLGRPDLAATAVDKEHRRWLPFVHDLIASAPADADRMDYLERDSKALGVSYGLFDRSRVLKSFLCFRRGAGDDTAYRLGVKRSGIPALENLVQARFELYVQVYYHKTNQAISCMLADIARRAHKAKIRLFAVDLSDLGGSLEHLVDRYLEINDDVFMQVLRGRIVALASLPPEAVLLAQAIHERRLWKRLYEGDEPGANLVAKALKTHEAGTPLADDILLDISKPKATKDLDTGATLLSRDESGIYTPIFNQSWYEFSIIIDALRKAEGNIGRVYATGRCLETTTFKRMQQSSRRLGRAYERRRQEVRAVEREIEARVRRELEPATELLLESIISGEVE